MSSTFNPANYLWVFLSLSLLSLFLYFLLFLLRCLFYNLISFYIASFFLCLFYYLISLSIAFFSCNFSFLLQFCVLCLSQVAFAWEREKWNLASIVQERTSEVRKFYSQTRSLKLTHQLAPSIAVTLWITNDGYDFLRCCEASLLQSKHVTHKKLKKFTERSSLFPLKLQSWLKTASVSYIKRAASRTQNTKVIVLLFMSGK